MSMRNTISFFLVACCTFVGYVAWQSFIEDTGALSPELATENARADTGGTVSVLSNVHGTSSIPEESVPIEDIHILFVGDIFLDRYIRQMADKYGEAHTFGCAADLLADADMVVGNLEGPITDNPSRSIGTKGDVPEHYTFTFATTTASLLARYNIRLVNLGNNHIGNFGSSGIDATREYLIGADVAYFGGLEGDESVHRDGTLSFVSYNQFGGQSSDAVASVIAHERGNGQQVVVYTHWGDEYVSTPGYLHTIAEKFVTSGASIVIGSHPHVVIPMEYINEVPVYYSLGNFIFDQYWNEEVSRGLAVLATISSEGVATKEHSVTQMPDGRVCLTAAVTEVGR